MLSQVVDTVLGVLLAALLAFLAWIARKIVSHDVALAVLIQQVSPPGQKSLRELLQDLQQEQQHTIANLHVMQEAHKLEAQKQES